MKESAKAMLTKFIHGTSILKNSRIRTSKTTNAGFKESQIVMWKRPRILLSDLGAELQMHAYSRGSCRRDFATF